MPEERKKHWFWFGMLALVYVLLGVGIRWEDVQNSTQDRENLHAALPQIFSLTKDMGEMKARLAQRSESVDPNRMTEMQAKVDSLIQMVPQLMASLNRGRKDINQEASNLRDVADTLSYLGESWYDAIDRLEGETRSKTIHLKDSNEQQRLGMQQQEQIQQINHRYQNQVRPLLALANRLRLDLVNSIPIPERTFPDKIPPDVFAQSAAKEEINYNQIRSVASYLRDLSRRLSH